MLDGVEFIHHNDIAQMYLNNVWRANLSITGADGLPDASKAGNVLRASTSVRLSLRLSPVFDCEKAIELLTEKLTKDVPFNAKVSIIGTNGGNGWCM